MSAKESDEEYDESLDEDFDPTKGDEAGSDSEEEIQKEIGKAGYANIESSEGGLVRTRTQRQGESHEKKFITETKKTTEDIDSIWADLKASSAPKPVREDKPEKKADDEEKIKIKTTYEFAGETVTEEKWVEKNSEEAKAYLNSVKLKTEEAKRPATAPQLRKGPVKRRRPGLLDDVINNSSTSKLSTLEKSRLDWASYVDKQGIKDELKTFNKGGYLQKQDFLARVESHKDKQYKDARDAQRKQ